MQELYREAVKNDAHLRSVINTRIQLVLANEFALFLNDKRVDNGLLEMPWFRKKLRFHLESNFLRLFIDISRFEKRKDNGCKAY